MLLTLTAFPCSDPLINWPPDSWQLPDQPNEARPTRVEWFTIFCDFRKWTHCWRSSIFLWIQFFKKICKFRTCWKVKKNSGTLKMNVFFILANAFRLHTYKKTCRKEYSKFNMLFWAPKMASWILKENKNLRFSSILAFYKNQRRHSPKKVSFFCAYFRVTVKFLGGPAPS